MMSESNGCIGTVVLQWFFGVLTVCQLATDPATCGQNGRTVKLLDSNSCGLRA